MYSCIPCSAALLPTPRIQKKVKEIKRPESEWLSFTYGLEQGSGIGKFPSIEHQLLQDMITNTLKVMFQISKTEHLPTPDIRGCFLVLINIYTYGHGY